MHVVVRRASGHWFVGHGVLRMSGPASRGHSTLRYATLRRHDDGDLAVSPPSTRGEIPQKSHTFCCLRKAADFRQEGSRHGLLLFHMKGLSWAFRSSVARSRWLLWRSKDALLCACHLFSYLLYDLPNCSVKQAPFSYSDLIPQPKTPAAETSKSPCVTASKCACKGRTSSPHP